MLAKRQLTPAELKYGRAPQRDPSVVYEPDVVIVDRGSEAIRALSADGLTWTIDARAPHVDELTVGKIAFVTGRCVGRVLQSTRDGDTLRLVLGPVELTDIFQSLDVTLDEAFDLDQSIENGAPQYEHLTLPIEGDDAQLPEWSETIQGGAPGKSADRAPTSRRFSSIPASFVAPRGQISPGIPQSIGLNFQTSPLKSGDGIGAELRHEGAGIRLVAQAQLRLDKPTVDFHLSIDHKKVDAKVLLHNAAGLHLAFEAGAGPNFSGNVDWYVPVPPPGELSIPIAGPVPLSVTLRQEIWVRTVFASKGSAFSAGGEYGLNGDIGFTYHDDKFDLVGPKGVTVKQSLMANLGSVSITPLGLVISHVGSITAGLGTGGFTTGPTMDVATSLGVAQGSSVGIVRCQGVAIGMNVRGGVGWTISRPIEQIVNSILSLIKVPPIKGRGGIKTDWKNLFNVEAQTDSPVCGGKGR